MFQWSACQAKIWTPYLEVPPVMTEYIGMTRHLCLMDAFQAFISKFANFKILVGWFHFGYCSSRANYFPENHFTTTLI